MQTLSAEGRYPSGLVSTGAAQQPGKPAAHEQFQIFWEICTHHNNEKCTFMNGMEEL